MSSAASLAPCPSCGERPPVWHEGSRGYTVSCCRLLARGASAAGAAARWNGVFALPAHEHAAGLDALKRESLALARRGLACGDLDEFGRGDRCELPKGHGGVHKQGGVWWN